MRDALWVTGVITASLKDTDYASTDGMDLGAIDARQKRLTANLHQTGAVDDLFGIIQLAATTAGTAADSFIPLVLESSDGTTYTVLAQGKQTGVNLVAGDRVAIKVPVAHKRYLKLGVTAKSTGTFTDPTTFNSWFELGPNVATTM